MKLILVRHGETIENKNRIVYGHLPGTLTDLGKEQAVKLAERLKHEKVDVIFVSDLERAVDTAEFIAQFHPTVPRFYLEELRERSFDSIEGGYQKNFPNHSAYKHPAAETDQSLIQRTGKFLEKISKDYREKTVLVVAHGGTNIALMANLLNKTFDEVLAWGDHHNTSVTVFENSQLKLFNCTQHLD